MRWSLLASAKKRKGSISCDAWGCAHHAVEHVADQAAKGLFDNAGDMGELLDTATLRGQIARFLHKRKDGEDATTKRPFVAGD
jgi:hypothetical protein